MGCFRINLSDPMELVFYGLSLLQAFRALQLAGTIRLNWTAVKQNPLTRTKAKQMDMAAFYLAVPPSVFVHELFHAVAIWWFGGRVVNCGYGFYWGFVQPDRFFLPSQEWMISLAGTIGSLLFGLVLWLLLRRHKSTSFQFFALRAFRFQLVYSLIFYPVFTAVSFIGDWRTIYDFRATPWLSAAMAVSHVAALGIYWWKNRDGWFEMVSHESGAEQERFSGLMRDAALSPHDTLPQLQIVDAMRRGGAVNKAQKRLKQFLEVHPDSGPGYLQLAAMQSGNKAQLPRQAARNAEKAINLGLSRPTDAAFAHQLLGAYYMEVGEWGKAVEHLSHTISQLTDTPSHAADAAKLYHQRSLAFRQQRQFDLAHQDVQQAISLARSSGSSNLEAYYLSELAIIEKHAGRASATQFPPTGMQ